MYKEQIKLFFDLVTGMSDKFHLGLGLAELRPQHGTGRTLTWVSLKEIPAGPAELWYLPRYGYKSELSSVFVLKIFIVEDTVEMGGFMSGQSSYLYEYLQGTRDNPVEETLFILKRGPLVIFAVICQD